MPKSVELEQNALTPRRADRTDYIFFITVSLLALAYVLIRVFAVSLTNDECILYTYKKGYADWFTFQFVDAQCHFLLGLLSMFCMDLLPIDEVIAIRLPSFLGLAIYLYAAVSLARAIQTRVLRYALFVALLGNAFMLDFFGLSRGYGLSLGLGLLSLSYLARLSLDRPGHMNRANAYICVWTASLAVLSNLAWLQFYSVVCAILFFFSIRNDSVAGDLRAFFTSANRFGEVMARNAYLFTNAALLLVFYHWRIILLVTRNKLYSGGTDGFVVDTVASLISRTLYDATLSETFVTPAAYIIFALSSALVLLSFLTLRNGSRESSVACTVSVVLALCFAVTELLHHVAGVRFVTRRAALMYVPLFVAQIAFVAASARIRIATAVGTAVLLAISAVGLRPVNLTHTASWKQVAQIREMLSDLESGRDPGDQEVIMGVSDNFKLLIDYYKTRAGMSWLKHYAIDTMWRFNGKIQVHPQTDYFYIWNKSMRDLPFETVPVETYGIADAILLEVKGPLSMPDSAGRPVTSESENTATPEN